MTQKQRNNDTIIRQKQADLREKLAKKRAHIVKQAA